MGGGGGGDDFENCWRSGRLLSIWALGQGPGPGQGPGGGDRNNQNPKSFCAVEKNDRDGRYARIDPSRQVIMTEAIFVLHNILKNSKTRGNLEKDRKNVENRILLHLGSYFSKWDGPIFP